MDIRQIRYFLAIVQEGQFTKAASKLNIAQPPLSQQIKLLEKELGVELLIRKAKGIELTEAGQVFTARGEQILNLVDSTKKELSDLSRGHHGTVTIGTVSSSGVSILPKYIKEFHERYPDVTFQVFEGNTIKILDLVSKGVVNIGIVRTPFNLSNYEYIVQASNKPNDPMVVIYTDNWQFRNEKVGLADLKDIPLIIHRRYEEIIMNAFSKHNIIPNILCKGEDVRSIIAWAELGIGIAMVPKPPANIFKPKDMKMSEINSKMLETKTVVIWLKNIYLSSVVKNFIRLIRSHDST
ncbi:transcriptional regulator, LysR family [Thermodesulfobium narugense DSM 14796]|uniref:Transcriptional regulator, LysR family n=1 Tax=Thermodesulfobium narugense DSM 14796 TaxID=747365 RepID=M1E8L9_9BACT|nr:LysR family transcriptional regulator [Thermodesulfobium narugense]AEE14554.1 transcriptional regulator, LysR family [Thermodesulfobium narugense DSM 14796]